MNDMRSSLAFPHSSTSTSIASLPTPIPINAFANGFFGRLKTELFYPRDWRTTTIEQFIQIVDSYIRWYNEKRINISLGSLGPIEYRESLGLTA